MNPTERVISAIDGKQPDRVPTFSYYLDSHPVAQVLGRSFLTKSSLILNPVSAFIYNRWGRKLKSLLLDPVSDAMWEKSIQAAVALGFDSVVGLFDRAFMIWDATTFARVTGSLYDIIDDGHGHTWYMYKEPAFKTPEDYENWPYFENADDLSHDTYTFFKKMLKRFGDDICILGQVATGIHETMLWSLGYTGLPKFIRKHPETIKKFIARLEELTMKTNMAMMDAGVQVIFCGDDMSFKTGPMMNPKTIDELFGPSYTRITKAVHDRGGRALVHSCGDNTLLFDLFIKWGFDGGHAYENTSNVDIEYEKKTHGDRFTMIGGVGVDYILTERSKPEEVVDEVKYLLRTCAPGGRFMLGPVHDHPDMDMEKVKVMLEAAKEYGAYPIQV